MLAKVAIEAEVRVSAARADNQQLECVVWRKRIDRLFALGCQPERRTTGRDDRKLRTGGDEMRDNGYTAQELLEVVEDHEQLLLANERGDDVDRQHSACLAQAKRGRDRRRE
ncbi:MAG: hypothetical protein M3Q31_13455 [Actinomycetota bacterium]|nr:hypothetical protein [Actinomycetota bacterium]